MRIEQRGKSLLLLCCCCNFPFARLLCGRLVIQSKHYDTKHTNALELEVAAAKSKFLVIPYWPGVNSLACFVNTLAHG